MLTVIGTPNNLAVWDASNDECMPQLLNGTGAPQWGDVANHPWTTGMQLDYASEAGLWAQWLQTEHPDVTPVAAVTFNNDFGKRYVSGFDRFDRGHGPRGRRAAVPRADGPRPHEPVHDDGRDRAPRSC